MAKLNYRSGDKLCPYCLDNGPFIERGSSLVAKYKVVRYYLECLACGNIWVRHSNRDYAGRKDALFQKGIIDRRPKECFCG